MDGTSIWLCGTGRRSASTHSFGGVGTRSLVAVAWHGTLLGPEGSDVTFNASDQYPLDPDGSGSGTVADHPSSHEPHSDLCRRWVVVGSPVF